MPKFSTSNSYGKKKRPKVFHGTAKKTLQLAEVGIFGLYLHYKSPRQNKSKKSSRLLLCCFVDAVVVVDSSVLWNVILCFCC